MQINSPSTAACPPNDAPAHDAGHYDKPRPIKRLLSMIHKRFAGNPRIRQLPIGHPDALVGRPGERRIVFGHNVLIIRDQPLAKE